MYTIGTKIWIQGEEITVTSLPYTQYGGLWQNGIDTTGKTYCFPTPEQQEANVKQAQAEYQEQQAGFKRLKELQKRTV